ncbi:MAG: esterase family protein [Bacteroidales bacterium]|nr:esterase family protein [Bacteroidales bacterium]
MSKFSSIYILSLLALLLASFSGCEKKVAGKDEEEPEPAPEEFQRYKRGIVYDNNAQVYKSTYQILLPADYENNVDTHYPVVYMLHGYGESGKDWNNWVTTIESLEKNGLQPMIYVFPDCNNSYYCNYYDEKAMYMNMIVDDLVPLIDETYRTIADREHRAVMGYSMGGFGAMVLPLKNPDVFSISVPLSMSFRTDEQYMTESQSGWDNQWGKIFGGKGHSGEARLTDYYKSHCPFYQFVPENLNELSKVKWFLHCGDDEEQLLIANDNLHVQMRDYGYEHEFRIGDGGHSGDYWRNAVRETLPWIEHVMKGGDEWTKVMGTVSLKSSVLNDDGSFSSKEYNEAEEKDGLATYLVHRGIDRAIVDKCIGLLTQSGSIFQYMVLPCDLEIQSLEEWIAYYTSKYEVGKSVEKSQVIAIGDTGKDVWAKNDQFKRFYLIDADLSDDESVIVAENEKFYFIWTTDDSPYYKDSNALYLSCKTVEADFEYRMYNGFGDNEEKVLYAIQKTSEKFKYQ